MISRSDICMYFTAGIQAIFLIARAFFIFLLQLVLLILV